MPVAEWAYKFDYSQRDIIIEGEESTRKRYIQKLQSWSRVLKEPTNHSGIEEINRNEEYQQATEMISASSVVPERAEICYHIVATSWYQRWEAFCKGQT